MSRPLISVIIPVYNVAKLLERCVDSVLAQTYDNLEIILINDGSTDMSGAFCDVYAKRDPRIKVIHQPNSGLSAARNTGLKVAKGNYLTFVDSDDYVEPNFIEYLLNPCQENKVKLSVCNFREFSGPKAEPLSIGEIAGSSIEVLDRLSALHRLLCDDGFSMSAWGKLYSRELFRGVTFPVGRLHEDVGTTYKLFLECDHIAVSSAKLYNYFLNEDSISRRPFTLRKLDLVDLTDAMCADLVDWSKRESPESAAEIDLLAKKRRAHARFSILRQIILVDPRTISPEDRESFLATRRSLVKYLRAHKSDIFANPLASKRDRLAMSSLLLGLPVFKFAWQQYAAKKSQNNHNQS